MKNKVLIELSVPEIDKVYNVYLPINRNIGNTIFLLNKAIFEFTDGVYIGMDNRFLYNAITGEKYDINSLIKNTNIRNGSRIILI